MSQLTTLTIQVLSVLTLVGDIGVIVLLLLLAFSKGKIAALNKNTTLLAFIISLVAVLSSLFFSQIAGFAPCNFCWWQRIFMYPQIILLGLALWKKEENILDYCLGLSIVGAIIAVYHYYLQIGGSPLIPCSTVGMSPSCSQRFFMEFGYITIPMMSFTAFLLMVVLIVANKLNKAD